MVVGLLDILRGDITRYRFGRVGGKSVCNTTVTYRLFAEREVDIHVWGEQMVSPLTVPY